MTRPIYETPDDLTREDAVAAAVAKAWNVEVRKIAAKYEFDRVCLKERVVSSFLEIKCRTNPSHQHPHYLISARKFWHAMSVNEMSGIPTYLVVAWSDRTGYYEINNEREYYVGLGGRTDRNDPQDIEPCVFISVSEFKSL